MAVKNNLKKIVIASLVVIIAACGGAEERKASYLEKGKSYLEEKNYDKARIEFKNVLQIDPKFAEGYYYMAQIEEHNKDLAKAAGNYNKAIELDPGHNRSKTNLAKIYTLVGTDEYINKANNLLEQVLAEEPNNGNAQLISAIIEYKKGDKDQATRKIETIVKENPSLIEGVKLLTTVYTMNDLHGKAINLLEKTIKENDDVLLKLTLARLYARDKMYDKAESQFKEIINAAPEEFKHRVALAGFYLALDKEGDAEAILRSAISDEPDDASRYLVLVDFLSTRKGVKNAEDALLDAIKKKPDLVELQFALGEFYKKTGKGEKLTDVFNSILSSEGLNPNGLRARNKLAEYYISNKDYDEAEKLINDVLEENPKDNSALYLSAKIAYARIDDATAINALRTVLKNEPKNDEAALLLAKAHDRNNEPDLARDVLVRILESDPSNVRNHVNQATYLAAGGKLDEALSAIDNALAYFKNNFDLLEVKYNVLTAKQDEKGMLRVLEQMKTFYPQRNEAYMLKGDYHAVRRQNDLALEEYMNALKYSSSNYKPLAAVTRTYVTMGKEQEAVSKLKDLINKNPDDVVAHQILGQVYARKDKEKALAHFEKAMSAGKWEMPYISVASIHVSNGDKSKAIDVLEKGTNVVNEPVMLYMQIAGIYESQSKYEDAINTYEKQLSLNPSNRIAANNLASLLVDHREDEESMKRALELAKDFNKINQPAFIDTLGWVLLKNGDAAGAVDTLKKAVELAPDVAVFQYHLGVAYQKLGNVEKAKLHLTSAVESQQNYTGKDKARELLAAL